jgi:FkbM family methyltransferase
VSSSAHDSVLNSTPERLTGIRRSFLMFVRRVLVQLIEAKVHGSGVMALAYSKVFLPRRKTIVPLQSGAEMALDLRNKHEVWMCFGLFAPLLQAAMDRILRPGDTFIDGGANVGYFSFYAAGCVGERGRVIAIEANPSCGERLRESQAVGGSDNVTILNLALGQQTGTMSFNVATDPMYSSIVDLPSLGFCSHLRQLQVPVETLDGVVETECKGVNRIRMLKLDIEGSELFALRGAEQLLRLQRFDYIYIETHQAQLKLLGQDEQDVYDVLAQNGYQLVEKAFGRCLYVSSSVLT